MSAIDPRRQRAGGGVLLSGLVAANLGTSFLQQLYVMIALGVGPETDAFFAATTVPALLFALASSTVTSLALPALAAAGSIAFRGTLQAHFVVMAAQAALVCSVLAASASAWVPLVLPGFEPAIASLTATLARINFAGTATALLGTVAVTACYARHEGVRAEAAGLGAGLAALALTAYAITRHGVVAATLAVNLKWPLLLIVLLPYLLRGAPLRWSSSWTECRRVAAQFGTMVSLSSIYKSGPLLDRFLASLAPPGSVTLLQLAQQLFSLPMQILDKTHTAPYMVRSRMGPDPESHVSVRRRGSQLAVAYCLALAVLLAALSCSEDFAPVAHRLDWERLVPVIAIFSLALLGGWPGQLAAGGLYALGAARAVALAAILTFAVSIALRAIGLAGLGVYGLAAGIASYPVLNSLVLSRLLARKLDRT